MPVFRNRRKRYSQRGIEILKPNDMTRLWILRLMVPLRGHQMFIGKNDFSDEDLATALGLNDWIDNPDRDYTPGDILVQLRKMYRAAERSSEKMKAPRKLTENIAQLAKLIGLNDIDCRILEFVVSIHLDNLLDEASDTLGSLSSADICHPLAILLDLPEKAIRASLASNALLSSSGLITVTRDGKDTLRNKLTLMSEGFAESILTWDVADPITLFRDRVVKGKEPDLSLSDFWYLSSKIEVLVPYLRHTVATAKQGVNILLYGPPGTGKTELSRILAKELACELFEVANEDEDGDPADSEQRLKAFRAGQCFFAQHGQTILLFDEVEDIFGSENIFFQDSKAAVSRKSWINTMLEKNAVPAIWISNTSRSIDKAFIRRFDMVIEMPVPPRRHRERIIQGVSGNMLPEESIHRIAANDRVAPAIVNRAVSVVRCIEAEVEKSTIPGRVEDLVNSTLEAQGYQPIRQNDPNHLPETYDPAFIQVDADLVAMADGLLKTKAGRLCLYGPPGTGKTAFGRWLAEKLDMPLHAQRGSDLLSMWVGGTEANIAKAFRDAEQDGALLLIDEVDSFLQDRRQASHSWEVTAVNEMLTQMESFAGVFIASTNLMEGLDQASLRRFDLKLHFGYLRPGQAWDLFQRQCAALNISAGSPTLQVELARLNTLTPGDFAAVVRQHRFRPIVNPFAFLAALEQECMVKENGQQKVIGF